MSLAGARRGGASRRAVTGEELRAAARRFAWPAVLLVALLASWWLLHEVRSAAKTRASAPQHVPDFYVEDFVSTTMGPDGKPRRRVKAKYMAHYGDTETSELTSPYMLLYQVTGTPWHVHSERGWVSANGEVMLLLGPVHIWRDDQAGTRITDVHTSDLRVLPNTSYGETDKPVTITTPTTESHGLGMRAYLADDRLELLSQVRTRYEKTATQ